MAKPNIHDVAKLCGLSTATVSHTINNTRYVSEPTREKVLNAIKVLGYSPDAFARSLRTGKKNIIGFIIPDISNQYCSILIESVEEVISTKGYHLIIVNTKETKQREIEHIKFLTSSVVDGLIIASTLKSCREIEEIVPENFPIVLVDRTFNDAVYDSIIVSNSQAIYQSVKSLIRDGHNRIGYIANLRHLSTTRDRLNGYMQAMKDSHIEIAEDYIVYGNSSEDSVFSCADKLISNHCTAIVVSNGIMTLKIIQYFHEHKMIINEKITVIGFVDFESDFYSTTPISAVVQPVRELGKKAGKQILKRITHPTDPIKEIVLNGIYVPKRD